LAWILHMPLWKQRAPFLLCLKTFRWQKSWYRPTSGNFRHIKKNILILWLLLYKLAAQIQTSKGKVGFVTSAPNFFSTPFPITCTVTFDRKLTWIGRNLAWISYRLSNGINVFSLLSLFWKNKSRRIRSHC
jgi:hypothetical protein